MIPSPITSSHPLGFFTGHVQGITFCTNYLFLSSVDTKEETGYLFKVDPTDFRLLDQAKLKVGEIYHPGGISSSGGYVYLPLSEYRADSSALVFEMDPETLTPVDAFTVDDHIGAVATEGEDYLFGMNWDAHDVYVWDIKGTQLSRFSNERDIAYQDIEYRNKQLYCSGIKRSRRGEGVVDIYDFDGADLTLSLHKTIEVPQVGAAQSMAKEAMTIKEGHFYFVPEDFPETTLYTLKDGE